MSIHTQGSRPGGPARFDGNRLEPENQLSFDRALFDEFDGGRSRRSDLTYYPPRSALMHMYTPRRSR